MLFAALIGCSSVDRASSEVTVDVVLRPEGSAQPYDLILSLPEELEQAPVIEGLTGAIYPALAHCPSDVDPELALSLQIDGGTIATATPSAAPGQDAPRRCVAEALAGKAVKGSPPESWQAKLILRRLAEDADR